MKIGEFEQIIFAEPHEIPQLVPEKIQEEEEKPELVPVKKGE